MELYAFSKYIWVVVQDTGVAEHRTEAGHIIDLEFMEVLNFLVYRYVLLLEVGSLQYGRGPLLFDIKIKVMSADNDKSQKVSRYNIQ